MSVCFSHHTFFLNFLSLHGRHNSRLISFAEIFLFILPQVIFSQGNYYPIVYMHTYIYRSCSLPFAKLVKSVSTICLFPNRFAAVANAKPLFLPQLRYLCHFLRERKGRRKRSVYTLHASQLASARVCFLCFIKSHKIQ